MAVTRDDVVQTAIQLLGEVGLDGLTLRRLATELGISAPTLYWHFKDKRELLDAMAEEMVRAQRASEPPIPEDWPWYDKIAETMRRQYHAILAYRDGARVMAGNRPTDASLPVIELYLSRWVAMGFPADEALASILSMGDFIVGAALEYQSEVERRRGQKMPAALKEWEDKVRPYPQLYAASKKRAESAMAGTRRDSFEHGLALFIAGLRVRRAEIEAQRKAGNDASPAGNLVETK